MLATVRIPTTTPNITLEAVAQFFEAATLKFGPLAAMAIGSFGPLSLNSAAPNFGHITSTPKPGWSDVDLLGFFGQRFAIAVILDTDVNSSAVGEWLFGNGRGLDSFCYVTIGTGIGVGLIVGGLPHGGANHPEAGHIRVPRALGDAEFEGHCPFHKDCLEGLASGPAMKARWGSRPPDIPIDHPAWEIEADYIATLCANLTYIVRPERIILGGGVMQMPHIYRLVREKLEAKLAGYDASIRNLDLQTYIARPKAGLSAGLWGAVASAYHLIEEEWPSHWRLVSIDFEIQQTRDSRESLLDRSA
jgi:fructokinase